MILQPCSTRREVLRHRTAPTLRNSTLAATPAQVVTQPASPYRKFEAVLLQTFVQEILPKDDQLFGDAASADISRSMMAEQLANQLAKSDRIGIARMIEKAHGPLHTAAPAIVPASPGQQAAVPALPSPELD